MRFVADERLDDTPIPSIAKISAEKNAITDYDKWFASRQYNSRNYHNGGANDALREKIIPTGVDPTITLKNRAYNLSKIIYQADRWLVLYGKPPNEFGVVLDASVLISYDPITKQKDYVIDFTAYGHDPSISDDELDNIFQDLNWVYQDGNILFVSNAHRTFASSSKNINAFVSAIDLRDLKLLWRSDPLVSNGENFVVDGDYIYCGYGFTDEHDYVYILSRATGKTLKRIPVKTGPEYFLIIADELHVRCYDTDYRFRLSQSSIVSCDASNQTADFVKIVLDPAITKLYR